MSPLLSLQSAFLISFVIESALYGVFLMLFVACMWVLVLRRRNEPAATRGPALTIYVAASIILMVLITFHFGLNFSRTLDAFVLSPPGPMGIPGPLAYYANSSNWKYLAKQTLWVVQTVIGDLLMTYRTYVIWGHWSVVVLPFIFIMTETVASSVVIFGFNKAQPTGDIFVTSAGRWIITSFVVMIATNMLTTGMIAYKLLKSHRAVGSRAFGQSSLMKVLTIIVESAAIYVLAILLTLILFLAKSNVQFITLDPLSPLTGIVFSMVIVRVGLAANNPSKHSNHAASSQGRYTGYTGNSHTGLTSDPRGIEVTILREVDNKYGDDRSFELNVVPRLGKHQV